MSEGTLSQGRVYVRYMGRFGNNLFNFAIGRIIAERLGFELHIKPIEGMPNTVLEMQDELPSDLDGQVVQTVHNFFDGFDELLADTTPRIIYVRGYLQRYWLYQPHKAMIKEAFYLPPSETYPVPGDRDLVVHVRSGDAWCWRLRTNEKRVWRR